VKDLSWDAFRHALVTTAPWKVAASMALTLASYACLSATEWLALRAQGRRFRYRDAAMVAVPAYALTNSAGFSPATGAAFRLQLYGRRGVPAKPAALVALTAGTAVTLSGPVTAGLAMLAAPASLAAAARAPAWMAMALGAVLLAPAAAWFVAFRREAPKWLGGGKRADLGWRPRVLGLAAGVGDWAFSCGALFVLLPAPDVRLLPGYLVAYIAGSLLSAASGVPGGIGVFEGVVLMLTTVMARVHETATALLLYRCIYSLGPLAIWGVTALIRRGVAHRREAAS
jgi:phosphatidylglycerol lysyltransferase